jgi:ribosome-binding ATPase YchF (GTP1/OBG family)
MLIALNLDETQLTQATEVVKTIATKKEAKNTKVLSFFGKIEMEMSELADDEAKIFMDEYGIKESALDTLIRESYTLLGLQSFLTVGEDECRAWTIPVNTRAQDAAGAIHSDLQKHFIRAETIRWDQLLEAGSEANARARGTLRLEGKDYIVQDGDVMHIRHSG